MERHALLRSVVALVAASVLLAPSLGHAKPKKPKDDPGSMTFTPEGGTAKELGPGSYWNMPGRLKHVSTCKPGADCLFLTTSRMRHETRMAPAKK